MSLLVQLIMYNGEVWAVKPSLPLNQVLQIHNLLQINVKITNVYSWSISELSSNSVS